MRGAIISFSSQKIRFAALRRTEVTQLSLPTEACVAVYTLPYTEDAFTQLDTRRKNKILQRLRKKLEKDGVICVYPVKALFGMLDGNFYVPDGRRIFSAFAGQIIERYINTFSMQPETTKVFVYENPFSEDGERIAGLMVPHTKQMYLVSKTVRNAEEAAKRLLEEYGLAVTVTDREKLLNTANIALLLTPPNGEILSAGLILDFSGKYPYRARRELYFETVLGYASFLKYFGRADCRSAEFILRCCMEKEEADMAFALEKIGWQVRWK